MNILEYVVGFRAWGLGILLPTMENYQMEEKMVDEMETRVSVALLEDSRPPGIVP